MHPDILSCNCVWLDFRWDIIERIMDVFFPKKCSICSGLLIEVTHRIINIELEELLVQEDQVLQSP